MVCIMRDAIPEHANSCKWCGELLRGGGDFHPECEEQDEAAHAYDRQVAAEEADEAAVDAWEREADGHVGIVGSNLGCFGEG